MDEAIKRLSQSKKDCEQANLHEGIKVGCRWAQKTAAYDELQRLANHFECLPPLEEEMLFDPMACRYTGAQLLYAVIAGIKEPDCDASESFWDSILNNHCAKAEQPDFLRGFVEGSLSIWDEVNGEL